MSVNKKKVNKRKRTSAKRKIPRTIGPKPAVLDELKKIILGAAILVSICLTIAMVFDILLKPDQWQAQKSAANETVKEMPDQTSVAARSSDSPAPVYPDAAETPKENPSGTVKVAEKTHTKGLKPKAKEKASQKPGTDKAGKSNIAYEVFHDSDHGVVEKQTPKVKADIPLIAIIIDDIGYDKKVPVAMHAINSEITFSVLPFSPYGRSLAEKLHAKGAELMLHLPMEPKEYPQVNPGPGAILSDMAPDVVIARLKRAMGNVPYIVGVNNHMGSGLTTQADKMNQIFSILRKENMFFIDSRTAAKSQCQASARLLSLKFAQRDVFLDNIQDPAYISAQFKKLLKQAKKHGTAIGIGHPYKATLEALSVEIPKIREQFKIVRASQLTHVPG